MSRLERRTTRLERRGVAKAPQGHWVDEAHATPDERGIVQLVLNGRYHALSLPDALALARDLFRSVDAVRDQADGATVHQRPKKRAPRSHGGNRAPRDLATPVTGRSSP